MEALEAVKLRSALLVGVLALSPATVAGRNDAANAQIDETGRVAREGKAPNFFANLMY
jgi:hypothetical protein